MKRTSWIQQREARARRPGMAFTMIELLVVVAIIGVLASLVVGGVGRAVRAGKESRLRADMNQLVTAIEQYQSALGTYPPDNTVDPARNPLFYELTGVMVDNVNLKFLPREGGKDLTVAQVRSYFNLEGFANAAAERSGSRRFLEPRAQQVGVISAEADDVKVLITSVPWTTIDPARYPSALRPPPLPPINLPGKTALNPWRYLSPDHATNNPGGFDLWVDYTDGKAVKRIGNWSKDPVVIWEP